MVKSNKKANAAIIVIGNEILSGRTQDQNVSFLAKWLNDLGIRVEEVRIIEDKEKSSLLDHGKNLAGDVSQEFKLENKFSDEIGWTEFLRKNVATWIYYSTEKKIKMQP